MYKLLKKNKTKNKQQTKQFGFSDVTFLKSLLVVVINKVQKFHQKIISRRAFYLTRHLTAVSSAGGAIALI